MASPASSLPPSSAEVGHRHVGELNIGGTTAVDQAIGPQREPARSFRQDKDPDPAVAEVRREQERIRHLGTEDDLLCAAQLVARDSLQRLRGRPAVLVGEGETAVAVDHRRQQRPALALGPERGDQPAAEHDGREIGLDHQVPAECLHQDRELDRAAAAAAIFECKGQAEPAEGGEFAPDLAAPAGVALGYPLKRAVVVALGQELVGAAAQKLVLGIVAKVHGCRLGLRGGRSGSNLDRGRARVQSGSNDRMAWKPRPDRRSRPLQWAAVLWKVT